MSLIRGKAQKRLKKFRALIMSRAALYNNNINFDVLLGNDHVALFPEIKICFNRIKKSANTSTSAFLYEIEQGFRGAANPNFKDELIRPNSLSYHDLGKIPYYYSLVVVRNPFTRTLSAFLDKVATGTKTRYSHMGGYGAPTADGFTDFLRFLFKARTLNRHFWPQVDLMFQPIGQFSYVAKVERLVMDMEVVLRDNDIDPSIANRLEKPHTAEGAGKLTNATAKVKEFYNDEAVRLVREIYRRDFVTLGYSQNVANCRLA